MCYSRCQCENYMGDCTLNFEDRKFLKEKYGVEYLCTEPMRNKQEQTEHDKWMRELYKEVLDQREEREIMRKLSNYK